MKKLKLLKDIPYSREEFEKQLAIIGWKIYKSGNGLNDFLINNKGESTYFVVHGDRLEIRKELFGSSHMGALVISLSDCKMEQLALKDEINCICLGMTNNNFINFYKHTD